MKAITPSQQKSVKELIDTGNEIVSHEIKNGNLLLRYIDLNPPKLYNKLMRIIGKKGKLKQLTIHDKN